VSIRIGLALVLAALFSAACGGDGKGSLLAPPTPAVTQAPKPYVPDEEPTPSNPQGRVTTQVVATCRLAAVDAEISANYKATVVGPESNLKRVRLLLNNKLAADSGDILSKDFEANVTLHVSSGSSYNLVVTAIATNAIGPHIINIVRCPPSPGPGA